MKEAQVLVSRCIILNVIKATKTQSTLERYMFWEFMQFQDCSAHFLNPSDLKIEQIGCTISRLHTHYLVTQ